MHDNLIVKLGSNNEIILTFCPFFMSFVPVLDFSLNG